VVHVAEQQAVIAGVAVFQCQGTLLLSEIDVRPVRYCGPLLEFHEGDRHPGDNSIFVNAKDQLSLSLLQARLIDLGMPIKVVEGT
jgi:hypothetical protein